MELTDRKIINLGHDKSDATPKVEPTQKGSGGGTAKINVADTRIKLGKVEFKAATGEEKDLSKTANINRVCVFDLLVEAGGVSKKVSCSLGIVTPEAIRGMAQGNNGMIITTPLHKMVTVSYYQESLIKEYIESILKSAKEKSLEATGANVMQGILASIYSLFKVNSIEDLK